MYNDDHTIVCMSDAHGRLAAVLPSTCVKYKPRFQLKNGENYPSGAMFHEDVPRYSEVNRHSVFILRIVITVVKIV
jgi:hypothetical protein